MPTPQLSLRGAGPREGLPDYVIRSLKADRLGIFTGIVERRFKVGAVNQRIDFAWLAKKNAPNPWNIPCVDAQADIGDGMCTVVYRYEGADQPDDSPEATVYELDTTMAEKPIETHPKFPQLRIEYLWDEDLRRFAEFVTEKKSAFAGVAQDGTNKVKSPLAGITSYFSVSAIYRITYAALKPRASLLKGLGTIVKSPRGVGAFQLPAAAKKRNWLKMAPRIVKRGNVCQITEQFALGHVGGFKTQIYSAGQLEEDADNS